MLFAALQYHHRYVRRSVVIAVTGSCGKTTAKELIHHVLSTRWRGLKSKGTRNGFYANAGLVLRSVPGWHRFVVLEAGTDKPGKLDFMCRGLRPDIGIVVMVGLDHYRNFKRREAVAEEKQQVVAHLPASGLAVLNADNALVLDMARCTQARVETCGLSESAHIRAENVSSVWPERLSFDVIVDGIRHPVRTRLCGAMWMPSILPAFSVCRHMGMTVQEVITGLETFETHESRMEPRVMPDGSTFMLDDWKAPLWSLESAIDFLEQALADRKILVLGTISDSPGGLSKRYAQIIRRVLAFTDYVVVTGSNSDKFKSLLDKFDPERVKIMSDLKAVSDYLDSIITPGSLVLIKGTNKQEHLSRLMHHRLKPVTCWSRDCRLQLLCRHCDKLYKRAGS